MPRLHMQGRRPGTKRKEQKRTFNFCHHQLQENDGHCKITP